jgi:hypothetical protein
MVRRLLLGLLFAIALAITATPASACGPYPFGC